MNISGHENQGAAHMSDEEAGVDASLESPNTEPAAAGATERDEPILQALAAQGPRARRRRCWWSSTAKPIGRACMALLGSQSEAEDALQETLIAALDGLESFRGDGTLRAWLLSIARRRCAQAARSAQRANASCKQSLAAPEARRRAPSGSAWRARARMLLDEIRPTEREALVLRFAAELSFREVGQACGIDEAAARKRVSRGLSRLRSLLGEDKS